MHEFKSWHCIQDEQFFHSFVVKIVLVFGKTENKWKKRPRIADKKYFYVLETCRYNNIYYFYKFANFVKTIYFK